MPSYHPIIYVRGYAMTEGERDETTADPFCGFNLGSTVYRASPDKKEKPRKFVFESPVLRLIKDHQYETVIENGMDLMDEGWNGKVPERSIIIFRYYEQASGLLGTGKTLSVIEFAQQLQELIRKLQEKVCATTGMAKADFRCHLVAHSMGGLVCRAFLQNDKCGTPATRKLVDKYFTYATPHNGIDMVGMNVPSWLGLNDLNNFNREAMRSYLAIDKLNPTGAEKGRADWLQEDKFPSRRVFCLIGSNRGDYEVAMGISRTFAGNGSDGLVKIQNASVWGVKANGDISQPCATAFVYRAHSGYFGIVNSEESYQNLTRFLFGDLRIDIWFDIDEVQVPDELRADDLKGKVDALYQFELAVSPRGKPWSLTRRKAEEDSPACRRHRDLRTGKSSKRVYLSTSFLSSSAKVEGRDDPTSPFNFRIALGIRVPDYIKDRTFWVDGHFEGGYLFQDGLTLSIARPDPATPNGKWSVSYDWERDHIGPATTPADPAELKRKDGKIIISVPVSADREDDHPSITGTLRFEVSAWE